MNEENSYRFDLWLYNELKKRDMTMKEFAEKAGISVESVHNYIHNKRMPTMSTLALILNVLDAHMEFVSN